MIHLIAGDFQDPYTNKPAVEIFLKIASDLKPDYFTLNGDLCEFRTISRHTKIINPALQGSLLAELDSNNKLLDSIDSALPRKTKKTFISGNHEWRIRNVFYDNPQNLELLSLPTIQQAASMKSILGLKKRGYVRVEEEYPTGILLNDDLYIEHGKYVAKWAGHLANRLITERLCNVITNHCEKLALVWRKVVGDRHFFGIENGHLSDIPKGSRATPPFNNPDMMNNQLGFTVLYRDGKDYFPVLVRIRNRKAYFDGKIYKA